MATGYTMPIHDGKPVTFRLFALRCARAFGALMILRDESLDAEIPEKFVPSDWHEKKITEARAALMAAEAMSERDAERAAEDRFAYEVERRDECARKRAGLRDRYQTMLAQVDAWAPPTEDHEGLKRFMREQLTESMEFDCGELWPEPVRMSGPAFRAEQIAKAKQDLEYHERELNQERKRCDSRNAWIRALRMSLPKDDARTTDAPRTAE